MTEYLTTREVAKYLRLNEKKIYDLVSKGQIPSVRISGKWLFPKGLLDIWLNKNTITPPGGLVHALMDQMLLLQGSDDPLLKLSISQFQRSTGFPVLSSQVGSTAGLQAMKNGLAHLASCHLGPDQTREQLSGGGDYSLINLFTREQGLVHRQPGTGKTPGLQQLLKPGVRFAMRQEGSGTQRLALEILESASLAPKDIENVGPFFSHGDVAQAVRTGRADVGLAIRWAAHHQGLGFVPYADETYQLALPLEAMSHKKTAEFLDFLFDAVPRQSSANYPGYDWSQIGTIQTMGN